MAARITRKKKIAENTVKVQNQPANKSSNTPVIVAVIAVVMIVLIALELNFALSKEAKMSKKPELIAYWHGAYKGMWGINLCGNYIYAMDHDQNQVHKYNKMTGELVAVYTVAKHDPMWAAEDMEGITYVVAKDSNTLLKFDGKKPAGTLVLDEVKSPCNIVINTKDILFLTDTSNSKIYKYDLTGKKLAEFGGAGQGKDQFKQGIGRIFIDAKDNLYVETSPIGFVKVFNPDGKFVKEWKLDIKAPIGFENLAIAPDGNIYVNDFNGSFVQVYNPNGKLIGKFDRDLTGNFIIVAPASITGGNDGQIYVCTHDIGVFKPIKY